MDILQFNLIECKLRLDKRMFRQDVTIKNCRFWYGRKIKMEILLKYFDNGI